MVRGFRAVVHLCLCTMMMVTASALPVPVTANAGASARSIARVMQRAWQHYSHPYAAVSLTQNTPVATVALPCQIGGDAGSAATSTPTVAETLYPVPSPTPCDRTPSPDTTRSLTVTATPSATPTVTPTFSASPALNHTQTARPLSSETPTVTTNTAGSSPSASSTPTPTPSTPRMSASQTETLVSTATKFTVTAQTTAVRVAVPTSTTTKGLTATRPPNRSSTASRTALPKTRTRMAAQTRTIAMRQTIKAASGSVTVTTGRLLGIAVATSTATALPIPTTNNPTINTNNGAVRSIANPSFELFDVAWAFTRWAHIDQSSMRGWFTTAPTSGYAYCCSGGADVAPGGTGRLIEVIPETNDFNNDPSPGYSIPNSPAPDGTYYSELNADYYSMLYQPICMANGETFSFSFYHHTRQINSTDIVEFRLGIPTSGLPANSVAGNSGYSRQIMRGATQQGATFATVTPTVTSYTGTTGLTGVVQSNGWVQYSGTHTLPASGWSGIYNLGFVSIQGTSASVGNLLDSIQIDLTPLVDIGTTRDNSAAEGGSAQSINLRINGKVPAGMKIALRKIGGSATPDTDFSLGTPNNATYGNGSITHTAGSDLWLVTVPAGYYDGEVFASNNVGGIDIPVTYTTDGLYEPVEWAQFEVQTAGTDGSTTDWTLADPTCDGSFKTSAVYSINNTAPTATPTETPTKTHTPLPTNTPTATGTATSTATATNTATPAACVPTVTVVAGYTYRIVTGTANCTLVLSSDVSKIDVLAVGGGGGGGFDSGGGGSGGQVVYTTDITVTPSSSVFVQVGAGGTGGTSGAKTGVTGSSTLFTANGTLTTALGGLGGGGCNWNGTNCQGANAGGAARAAIGAVTNVGGGAGGNGFCFSSTGASCAGANAAQAGGGGYSLTLYGSSLTFGGGGTGGSVGTQGTGYGGGGGGGAGNASGATGTTGFLVLKRTDAPDRRRTDVYAVWRQRIDECVE